MGPAARTTPAGGQAPVILLLSLNLILLAFFILLNALSDYQIDRTRAALQSVDRTFSEGLSVPQAVSETPAGLGAMPHARDLLLDIGSAFEAAIPAARSTVNDRTAVLSIEFPAAAFFAEGKARLRPASEALLLRLAGGLIGDGSPTFAHRVAFYYPSKHGSASRAAEIARASLVARRLQARLTPETVSIGLQPRLDAMVRFVIRLESAARSEGAGQGVDGDG